MQRNDLAQKFKGSNDLNALNYLNTWNGILS